MAPWTGGLLIRGFCVGLDDRAGALPLDSLPRRERNGAVAGNLFIAMNCEQRCRIRLQELGDSVAAEINVAAEIEDAVLAASLQ